MKNKCVEISFKKLLGDGRAWSSPSEFMSDFLEVLAAPLCEIKEKLESLKFAHFTTRFFDETNILNNEELFDIVQKRDTLGQRAEDVELAWRMLSGNSNYKTLEDFLQRAGFDIYVVENTDAAVNLGGGFLYNSCEYGEMTDDSTVQYGGHTTKVVGNGYLNVAGISKDPAQFVNGKHAFYIVGFFDPNESEWERIIEIVLKLKPAHVVGVCKISERKKADNEYYNTMSFIDYIDGGEPGTTLFMEKLNKNEGV